MYNLALVGCIIEAKAKVFMKKLVIFPFPAFEF
jgi:hypothetical protein